MSMKLGGLPLRSAHANVGRACALEMREARSYDEWSRAAKRYDDATGRAAWREEETSAEYDHALIRRRLDRLRRLRAHVDDERLLFALSEGIHGNFGGMGRASLYSRTAFGTKQLIEEYVDAVAEALEHLATETRSGIDTQRKRDFFQRASRSFGHTALMLSGSGTMFFFHVGVLRALLGERLLPSVLSGSSGGALVAAVLGTRAPEEWPSVLTHETFSHFIGRRTLVPASVLGKVLEDVEIVQETLLPDLTFQKAYARSGLAINISVAPTDPHHRSRLLNAITSPHVCVREAILASGAFPGLAPPVALVAETADGDRRPYLSHHRWIDGSMGDDLPAKRLARLFGVNHYIVSQTNPHILPFITDPKLDTRPLTVLRRTGQRALRELINGTATLVVPALRFTPRLARASSVFLNVINQDYLGDINIVPSPLPNPLRSLDYRTETEARDLIRAGERATWRRVEMIRTQTKISRTLDRILRQTAASRSAFDPIGTPHAGRTPA